MSLIELATKLNVIGCQLDRHVRENYTLEMATRKSLTGIQADIRQVEMDLRILVHELTKVKP